jgi:ParB-like nuclease domain
MESLPCRDPKPVRLHRDPGFQPCEAQEGDELYANGIFEFNITRLLAYIGTAGGFRAELIVLAEIPHSGDSAGLSEQTIVDADLLRPVILAEIAPGRYNLIDGHHRVAKARRLGARSVPAHRIRCPDHVAFLTSTRAYEAYVEYWNSKLEDVPAAQALGRRTEGSRGRR